MTKSGGAFVVEILTFPADWLSSESIDNTIASFLVVVPLLVSTLGLKATVLAEAKPLTRDNKDNHTNRNALFLFITFEVCKNHPTSKHTLGEEFRSIRHLLGLIIK